MELKKHMDQTFGPYWHVVCGKNFGCYAIHNSRCFIFFYIESVAYLFYKSG
jgi:dynein light chain LC8-type